MHEYIYKIVLDFTDRFVLQSVLKAGVPNSRALAYYQVAAHAELGHTGCGQVCVCTSGRCSCTKLRLWKWEACAPTVCTNGIAHVYVHACRLPGTIPSPTTYPTQCAKQERLGTAALRFQQMPRTWET